MLDTTLSKIRRFIPSKIFNFFQPIYHYKLALLAAIFYGFPSKKIKVIAVTGTKGKSTTTEIINAILEKAGYRTALSNTIRFKVAEKNWNNKYKMSMPGRFFMQRFIRKAVSKKCNYIILEMTSQGVPNYRHKFIELDALVFTNLSPEHIEFHGSYEKYRDAKLEIARGFSKSKKRPRIMIVNGDDKESEKFLAFSAETKKKFGMDDSVQNNLPGNFNQYNIAGAVTLARALGIEENIIKEAIRNFDAPRGRVEKINMGQNFSIIVDYAHTTDSLEKLYKTFPNTRKICVLGGTGGGRDIWKRKEMGAVADKYCDEIILTNEDPYDENPEKIVRDVEEGIENKKPEIFMDRREAIARALRKAHVGDTVLITGKGTDPYIMGPNGTKIPWDDATVAREELIKFILN